MTVVTRRVWPAMTFVFVALVAVILVLLMNVRHTPPAPFTLNGQPHQQAVRAGDSAAFQVEATFAGNYQGRIDLVAGQLPVGLSVRFSRTTLTPGTGKTTDVTVTTTTAISPGTYEVPVIGRNGRLSSTAGLLLVISDDSGAPTG